MEDKAMPNTHVQILGPVNSAETYELRDFMKRSDIPFTWTELASDQQAQQAAGVASLQDASLPICILEHGSKLFHPTVHDLACALDWFKGPTLPVYDLAIFGAGPAGLSAAVYAASEGLSTIVIERGAVGGQAGSTSRIENYLGFPDGIAGWDLATRARQQAQRLGAEIIVTEEGVSGELKDGLMVSQLSSGATMSAKATICATGVDYNRLGLENEDRFLNHGLYYGAGSSEAGLCKGHIFIVGGGNSAGQAALNFAAHADKVTLLVRGTSLAKTLSAYLLKRIQANERVEVCTEVELSGLHGTDALEGITYTSRHDGKQYDRPTNWVFICIGGKPRTDWAKAGTLLTDEAGYVLTGHDLEGKELPSEYWTSDRRPLFMETSIPGLFAAGDVRHNSVKRCATAVGDGATAVSMVHEYLTIKG